MSHSVFQRMLSYIEQDITRKQVLGGNKVFPPKERLALTISHTQNCLALLPSFHPWWPRLGLLNCACACSTMLKERGKWLQLRFNIPNILENKRNVEWMLKQSLKAFKLFQHRFNILSTRFNNVEGGWQTLSTLPFNKIERMLKQMLKPFARALLHLCQKYGTMWRAWFSCYIQNGAEKVSEKIRSLVRFLGFYTINMQIPFKVTLQNKA